MASRPDSESTVTHFARPPSAQAAVLSELRRRISEGTLRSGGRIVAETVAGELGVSRVPVREALKVLEGEGLVSYTPHHGYFVTELDPDDLWEIFRMRELLESEAMRLAASALNDDALALLDVVLDDLARADGEDDNVAFAAAAKRFQFALFEPAERPWLARFIGMLWESFDRYRALFYVAASRRRSVMRDYREIRTALGRRETERAIELLADHRRRSIETLAAHIEAHAN